MAGEPRKVDLTLKDSQGQKVHLRDYRGKVTVLNFWATWCAPCNAEMPVLVEAAKQYADRGVSFIGASLDDANTRDSIPAFVHKYSVTFPIWYGATADDLDKLSLGQVAPATAFLDEEGHVVARIEGQMREAARIEGQMREAELKERIEWLIGSRTGAPPESLIKHLEKLQLDSCEQIERAHALRPPVPADSLPRLPGPSRVDESIWQTRIEPVAL